MAKKEASASLPNGADCEEESKQQGGAGGIDEGLEVIPAPPPRDKYVSLKYGVSRYQDHFSLPIRSSTIRFRSSAIAHRVYENKHSQFVLEQSPDTITVKKMGDSTTPLKFLRAVYSLICVFFTGFLVVFAVQILLFVILDLTIELGATSSSAGNARKAVGVILSLPVFIHGLASALVIAGYYIADTWGGFYLVRTFVFAKYSEVVTAWLTFAVFLGFPLLVMSITLLSGTDIWWEITALFWFSCVFLFYIFFCIAVMAFEMKACLEVLKNQFDDDKDDIVSLIKRAILLRQIHTYSGKRSKVYLVRGSLEDVAGEEVRASEEAMHYFRGPYSRMTEMKCLSRFYDQIGEPGQHIYTLEDAQGIRPFMTRHTWSLEKLYCRPNHSRYVAVIAGPSAMTRSQMRSSFICVFVGKALIILLVTSFLVWAGLGGDFVAIVLVLMALYFIPSMRQTYRIFVLLRDMINVRTEVKEKMATDRVIVAQDPGIDEETAEEGQTTANPVEIAEHDQDPSNSDASKESEGMYQVWDNARMTRPKEWFCWVSFGLEVVFFILWPLIGLFVVNNYAIAVLFLLIALFSAIRYYFNAAIVLEEVGHLDYVQGDTEAQRWKKRSRINEIVGKISRGRSRGAWTVVLSVFVFVFLALLLGAVLQGNNDTSSDVTYKFRPEFFYEQKQDLPYPTCTFGKGLENAPTRAMADYAFLAGLAYRDDNITQGELDQWFGADVVKNDVETVERFQKSRYADSAVSYKLFVFPEGNRTDALVAIRGTTNPWDAFADAQLWSGASCFQMLRFLLPLGDIFTPIFPNLVNLISWLESESILRVSFYRETTAFVKELEASGLYENIQVTGHSLGGGLSIITGAQSNVSAVALSGPNAMISRKSFDPEVSVEALDRLTFNIVPERDVVPMFDDKADLYQNIKCRADKNDFIGCHDSTRSLCEILSTCGTKDRPALCECVTTYGYPKPEPKDPSGLTFEQLCSSGTESV